MRAISASLFAATLAIAASKASAAEQPLSLEMKSGSDVRHGRNATVTVEVRNTSAEPVTVYLRRDLMTFEVVGPGGDATTCSPIDVRRHPGRRSFTTLPPHRSLAMKTRLVELCPRWTFSKRGEYRVRASYATNATGQSYGFHAYTGALEAEQPAVVRVEHNAHVVRNHAVAPPPSSRPSAPAPAPTPAASTPPKARAVPVRR